jgi:hypothetical protein
VQSLTIGGFFYSDFTDVQEFSMATIEFINESTFSVTFQARFQPQGSPDVQNLGTFQLYQGYTQDVAVGDDGMFGYRKEINPPGGSQYWGLWDDFPIHPGTQSPVKVVVG